MTKPKREVTPPPEVYLVETYATHAGWGYYPGETFPRAALEARGVTEEGLQLLLHQGHLVPLDVDAAPPVIPFATVVEAMVAEPNSPDPNPETDAPA